MSDDAPSPRSEGRAEKRDAGERGAGRADTPRANEDRGARRQKSADDGSVDEGKGRDRKSRAETKDKGSDRKATKSADDSKAKTDSQAKSDKADTERGDRDRVGKDAADTDKAKPADKAKQAEGDRKPVDDVKKADLSGEKRERVGAAFRGSHDVKRRTDVDIDISIGRRVPRDWDFAPVPVAVIEVVPEYRGYVYAYVDDEYVICDPETYEIVAVLPASGGGPEYAGGGGAAAVADRCSTSLTLSEDEREDILRSIQMTDEVDVSDITVGWSVPGEIELKTFPEPILSRTGKLAACRYFLADDQIAIVDPAEETVVLLIDQE